jgi:PKD repeat protein/glucose/arabinose dehydrogenase
LPASFNQPILQMTDMRASRVRVIASAVVFALLVLIPGAAATTLPSGFAEVNLVAGGGLSAPTAVAYAPDGRMFIAEKAGRVKVVNPGSSTAIPLLSITSKVNHFSDRGLLGIEVDTDFESNGFLYLLYVHELSPATPDTSAPMVSRLTRVTVRPDNMLVLPEGSTDPETVILGKDSNGPCPTPDNTRDCITSDFYWHAIGTVRSDPTDGTLWVGSGDSHNDPVDGLTWRPYNEHTFAGKIMHIDREGRGLPNHPFCPNDTNLDHVCTKIYAKGFRNPFRFHLRPGKGPVVGDVGSSRREEVDFIRPGGNYGWPCYEGTHRPASRQSQPECTALYAKEGTPEAAIPPNWEYDHSGGASITLGPIYDGSTYPSHFRGDLFVGDYVQGWIKRLEIDANDNVTAVHDWATGWAGGVDLEMHPSGDLSNVDIGFGGVPAVARYTYTGSTNSPPVTVASATPTSGPSPLTVQFTGSGSSDPDGDALTYDWDFGDGTAHSALADPSHTYTTDGDYTATLTVTDAQGHSSSDTVPIAATGNQAPTVNIAAPVDEFLYRDGSAVTLQGSGSDPEDGALGGASLTWRVLLHHGTHTHSLTDGVTGSEASFTPLVNHDSDSYYEIRLTAVDSGGRSASQTIEIRPETSDLELASSPVGAPLAYVDDQRAAPFSLRPAIGYEAQLSAPETFVRGGRTYRFQGWSDGGTRNHEITVPAGSPQYTATYRADGVDTLVFSPVADTHVDDLTPSTSYGTLDHVEVDAAHHVREGFLKFDLAGLDGRQVLGARLAMRQVDNPDGSPYGGDIHALSSNSWPETTTWNTRPTLGAKLASIGPVEFGRRYEADLGAAAVDGDGPLSLGMRTPDVDGSAWASRESPNPPQLIVEVARHACSDGEDNDGDGNSDFPADLGCLSGTDQDENQAPGAVASASPRSGAAPLTVAFTGSDSSDSEGAALSYDWDFGDGTAHSSDANPGHTYGAPGTYTATLTVSDEHGSTASDTVEIVVGLPVAEEPSGGSSDGPAPSLLPVTDPILPPPFTGTGLEKRRAIVRRGGVSLVLSCPSDAAEVCRGAVSLSHRVRTPASRAGAGAVAKTVRLGDAKFSIASGKSGRVRVKLSPAGRRMLAGRRRLKVDLKTTARDGLSRKRTTKSWVVLEMPARRSS